MRSHLYDVSAVANAGVPAYALNNGIWNPATIALAGAGSVTQPTVAGLGYVTGGTGTPPTGGVSLATHVGVLAGSELRSFALNQTSAELKGMTSLQEGAIGASSVLANMDYGMAVLRLLATQGRAHVVAMGRITGDAVSPSWEWATGAIDQTTNLGTGATGILRTGLGDYDFTLLADRGVAEANTIILAQVNSAGLRMTTAAINHDSATTKRLTILEEGAAGVTSIFADLDVNIVILKIGAPPGNIVGRLHAMAACDGVTNDYAWASGNIDQTGGLNTTGPGVYVINYLADRGIAPADSITFFTPRGTLVPNVGAGTGLVTITPDTTGGSAVTFGVDVLQEGIAGAISTPADFNFDFACFSRAA